MTDAHPTFTTLEDLLSVFATTQGSECAARFAEGDALILASDPATLARMGFQTRAELLLAVGSRLGRSKRALEYRVTVARTFGPADREEAVAWDVYRAAAGTDNPLLWLHYAADNHLSADKLRGLYKQVEGKKLDETVITWPIRHADARLQGVQVREARGERKRALFVVFEVTGDVDAAALALGAVGQLSFSVVAGTQQGDVHGVAQEAEAA